jgi:Ca2+-binding RTX toxin-like protein
MATYAFETITAAEALSITAADTLTFASGPSNQVTVLYNAGGTVTIVAGARAVEFASTVAAVSMAGRLQTSDGSRLWIGDLGAETTLAPASPGDDGLYGGAGNDRLDGGDGNDLLQGNTGVDDLSGQGGDDVIYGGQDNDRIDVGASPNPGGTNFGQGNRGDDTVSGSPADNDTLLGGQGNDVINITDPGTPRDLGLLDNRQGFSGGGNDFLNGNLGNDTIFAGEGNDTIFGEDGDDFLQDGGGTNVITSGNGADTVIARADNTIDAGTGNDIVGMDTGRFVIQLGDGDDLCLPLSLAATDAATIDGGAGNDEISASSGGDSIQGGIGTDTLDGGAGADTLAGGADSDQFQFFPSTVPATAAGLDRITDWASEDRLFFADGSNTPTGAGSAGNYVESTQADYAAALSFANGQVAAGQNYVAVQVGADVVVFADSGGDNGTADSAVMLVGRALTDIAFDDFE